MTKQQAQQMVATLKEGAAKTVRDTFPSLPTRFRNRGQRKLFYLSGSPAQFRDAVIETLGEVSVDEAIKAIQDFCELWNHQVH